MILRTAVIKIRFALLPSARLYEVTALLLLDST